jgi:hypothetical protein
MATPCYTFLDLGNFSGYDTTIWFAAIKATFLFLTQVPAAKTVALKQTGIKR